MRKSLVVPIVFLSLIGSAHAQFSGATSSDGHQNNGLTQQQLDAAIAAARTAAAAAAVAQADVETGQAAERRGDYATAQAQYRKACIEGRHPLGCTSIAWMYHAGRGVSENLPEAANWYQRALVLDPTNGSLSGNLRLVNGLIAYRRGDYVTAMTQWRAGCSLRSSMSCANIGSIYHNGQGVPRNIDEAVTWYDSAINIDPANNQAITNRGLARPLNSTAPAGNVTNSNGAGLVSSSLATPAQTRLLASAIAQDSKSWAFNRFDDGSLSDVRVSSTNSKITTIRGNYTFNQRRNNGWASVQIQSGRVLCITYWDTYSCNSVRPVPVPKTDAELRAEDQQRQDADRNYWRHREEKYQACVRRYEDRRLGEHACTY